MQVKESNTVSTEKGIVEIDIGLRHHNDIFDIQNKKHFKVYNWLVINN